MHLLIITIFVTILDVAVDNDKSKTSLEVKIDSSTILLLSYSMQVITIAFVTNVIAH